MQALLSKILDLPHATLLTYVGIICAAIAYASGEISILQAFAAVTGTTAAAAGLGVARNGSGRGVK